MRRISAALAGALVLLAVVPLVAGPFLDISVKAFDARSPVVKVAAVSARLGELDVWLLAEGRHARIGHPLRDEEGCCDALESMHKLSRRNDAADGVEFATPNFISEYRR